MANFEMVLSGASTLIFPITPEFFPKKDSVWKRDGKQENVVESVPVHGWFSEDDPGLKAKIAQLHALAANKTFLTFVFQDKNTLEEIYRLDRGKITNFEEVESDGSRANHVEFRFLIEEERGSFFADLVAFSSEETIRKARMDNGTIRTILTKTVSATGTYGNLAPARAFVKSRKPNGPLFSEEIREVEFDGTVTGTWEVDVEAATKAPRFLRWDETASFSPGVPALTWYRTPGSPFPLEGGFGPSAIRVSGTIRVDRSPKAPSPAEIVGHFMHGIAGVDSGPFLRDFSIDSPHPVEFDVDKPDVPIVWDMSYSFTLEFGENPESPFPPAVNVRPSVRFGREFLGGLSGAAQAGQSLDIFAEVGGTGSPPGGGTGGSGFPAVGGAGIVVPPSGP